MHNYHRMWLEQGAFTYADYLASFKSYPGEHKRAAEAADGLLSSATPEQAFLLMAQTWKAIGEAIDASACDAVLIAWVPAIQACLDAVPAIRAALKAKHEAPDPEFERVMREVESVLAAGGKVYR